MKALEVISERFGVRFETLERLAGYRANKASIENETRDPSLSAMMDAEVAEIQSDMEGIPPIFVPAVLAAQRQARRAAVQLTRAALELVRPHAQDAISNAACSELAPASNGEHKKDDDGSGPAGIPLVRLFQPAAAMLAIG